MLSVIDIARRIDAGDLTPATSIRAAHDAIMAADTEINAFVHVDGAAQAQSTGPLRGVPVGVKDIIDTADMPTEMGSPIYAGWRPKADAPVVMALKRAGATPIGKTATTPFAYIDPAATHNPRDLAHTPGGSSSGSAAAVAAGMVPLALGTQTGGSIIRPASYCGVAAVKPSFRLIPTVGVKCFSWALDTVGMFAATVADVAYGLAAVTGRIPNSGRLVLPTITKPASRRRRTTNASWAGTKSPKMSDPSVCGIPATAAVSLTAIGTPANGRSSPGPMASAAARAPSASTWTKALTSG